MFPRGVVVGMTRRLVHIICLVVLLFVKDIVMVKHGDFKRCQQSGFCVRQSAFADLVDKVPSFGFQFELLPDSVKIDEGRGVVTAHLLDQKQKTPFIFELSLLERDTARVRIKEAPPIKPRYELLGDLALASALPASVPIAKVNRSSTGEEIAVHFGASGKNLLILRARPFRFELSVNGEPAVSFNDKGYLYYEHSRTKESTPALENQAAGAADGSVPVEEGANKDDEITKLKEALNKDMWEETFNGKTDSKPNGPASIGFDVSFPGSSNIYGIPQHASTFSLKTTRGENREYDQPYRLYNLDVFEYILDSPMALYGSIPFMLSHKKGVSSGVFWLNSAEMWIDVEKAKGTGTLSKLASYIPFATSKETSATTTSTHWMAESGVLDLFVFVGSTPNDIFDSFTAITGRPTMPQHFATAYHQCRWNYMDEQDVADVNAGFEKHDIPYDVLWLDIEHTDGKKYFTWDKTKFPNPEIMQNNLAVNGRKMVTIIDPHIKRDDGYYITKEAREKGLFIKDKDGNEFDGWCWPGSSSWIDYTDLAARQYWAEKFQFSEYKGSTPSLYTWNDMNEPSVFTGPEVTMPKDALHHGGVEHRDVHNVYGALLHRSTCEGHLLRSKNEDRPFVLSRAFFAGTQRYGAIWTGDNTAEWDHLAASVPMILSIGVAGVVFSGADVGGFFGNPEPDLLLRWYQVAAFQPFFRAHAHIDTKRREPWLFGEPYTSLIREAIRQRYRIMPYLYTLFWQSTQNGSPIMRPMVSEFPEDENTFGMGDQFMLGKGLLIKPVVQKDQSSVDVYLPKLAVWYDYASLGKVSPSVAGILNVKTPLEKIPVLLRGGTILPRRERIRRASNLMLRDPYTLLIALDHKGEATGTIYADDGRSFRFREGKYVLSDLAYSSGTLSARGVRLGNDGKLSDADVDALGARVERLIITGLSGLPKKVEMDGRQLGFTGEKVDGDVYKIVVKDPKAWVGRDWKIHLE
ncbi:hypothetical protein SpCBS45565_g03933 [Spizellomyces sp. 'palustris']|nr:hypothetical protein SpCBS45565_g03933 [Spizellomyces sp. 'palustris']